MSESHQLECTVDVDVSLAFAWQFRTDVSTWDDPPAVFVLHDAFIDGARGETRLPGESPRSWFVRHVDHERSFTIEMPLDGATLSFEWDFVALSATRTRLTHRIRLLGPKASDYDRDVSAGFRPTLFSGMKRIAGAMEAAAREQTGRAGT
jgi:hypothetical protein